MHHGETDDLRRRWWPALVVFFLLGAAWALATPYNGAYDEHDHVVRAAGVVRGQILVAPAYGKNDGGYQSVPASLVPPHPDCLAVASPPPATCLGTAPADRTARPVHTRAARYNPAYYLIVGWPLAVLPTMTGVILARLVSALLCAALLASALITIWPMRRYRMMPLALLLAVAPMVTSLGGLVNPSGLAIDAAILLWVALIRLLAPDGGAAPPDRRLVARAAVAAVTVVLARPEGVALVVVIGLLAGFVAGEPRIFRIRHLLRALRERQGLRWAAVAVAAAAVAAAGWLLASHAGSIGAGATANTQPTSVVLRMILQTKVDFWVRQTVGFFGYGSVGLPLWTYVAWSMVAGLLVLTGFAHATRLRLGATIIAIPLLCLLAGVAAELIMVRVVGYWMQGRYFLPIWVGMFFLAALAVPESLTGIRALRRTYAVTVAVWSLTTGLGLVAAMLVFRGGKAPAGLAAWHPSVGTAVPPAVMLLGLLGAAVLAGTYVRGAGLRDGGATGVSR